VKRLSAESSSFFDTI